MKNLTDPVTHERKPAGGRFRLRWVAQMVTVAFALSSGMLLGQNSSAARETTLDGSKIFALRCAGCHGADAHGTDHAPPLVGSRSVRERSISQLHDFIRNGQPTLGMPAFDLPAGELDALATLVRSLNVPAASSAVPGDAAAGERFFLGKGECASCHMVYGRGEAIGPDLSNIANEMSFGEIRGKLLQPDVRITPDYELVSVRLRDGKTLRGFARGRGDADIQLQDFKGNFHLLHEGQIAAIDDENGSPMPPVKANPEELQDLIAYLGGLTGVKAGMPPVADTSDTAGIDFAKIENPKPGEWPTYNGTLNANRYSDLTQINANTVSKLGLKWVFTIPVWKWFLPDTPYYHEKMKDFAVEVTPLVVDGVMYVTGPNSVYALDAVTGREIWEYTRPRTPGLFSDTSLGTNRGVAVLGDKVFRMTDNAHLIALNRTTGSLVWEVVMTDAPEHYGSTSAPLIVKDMVVAGVSGSDWGIRGFVAAYKASTGKRVWRFWTIPAKGEPGIETWKGSEPKFGGGGTWSTGSYDSETDTLYWSTATPWPDSDDRDRPGDNLFTDSVLALDPGTGKLKWHYQFTPHDTHAYDATEPNVLVDTRYQGKDRKLLLHADRNGFFYVFDRTHGKILLATKLVNQVAWASGIDPDGRPHLLPDEGITCPVTATNWNATAFSPVTRLYYVMTDDRCEVRFSQAAQKIAKLKDQSGTRYLRALDIETGKRVWEIPQVGPVGNRFEGLLATAGGLIIYGDPNGDIMAVDERDGKRLWHFTTNGINDASPMTYSVGGKQFIALAVGPNIMCFGLP